jgi:hypothetical protein
VLDLYCEIRVRDLDPVGTRPEGKVVGFDPRTKKIFVLWPEYPVLAARAPHELAVLRKDEKVGVARGGETHGEFVIFELLDGEVAAGDNIVWE